MSFSAEYTLGLFFIFCVALIWAGSSILVQSLYTDFDFDSPFLLTYIGSSIFTLWLPTQYLTQWIKQREWGHGFFQTNNNVVASENNNHGQLTTTSTSGNNNVTSLPTVSPTTSYHEVGPGDDDEDEPLDNHETFTDEPDVVANSHGRHWTHEQHFRAALWIAPVWFLANWTYNASLEQTSITSSTVLASTGSLFTFLFAVTTRDERFGWIKLCGVVLGVLGSVWTALSDKPPSSNGDPNNDDAWDIGDASAQQPHRILLRALLGRGLQTMMQQSEDDQTHDRALWGDLLGLISAIGYGGYAVMTRVLCPHDESLYSMQLLLGYIGLISMMTLSPIVLWILVARNFQVASAWVFGALIVKGLLDNVLSDYLWLRAVILTNATVATVGLGMTIPLAFLSDILWSHQDNVLSFLSIMGALAVLAGFVLVNVGNQGDDSDVHPTGTEGSTSSGGFELNDAAEDGGEDAENVEVSASSREAGFYNTTQ